eukprot:CAMPEP_0170094752 /NCGR_PEP_ID=MMETSP0019_2-20121128/27487_1 /TAXON_ID=98059 /ORGANISM="Dinobryon sp., Strain UTEXLB2267" /LENGTH=199 /DNA_ID=CAMNT_0010316231 /DNA_START=382 /DNA_END=977 /DNA_ORIENTATION=+
MEKLISRYFKCYFHDPNNDIEHMRTSKLRMSSLAETSLLGIFGCEIPRGGIPAGPRLPSAGSVSQAVRLVCGEAACESVRAIPAAADCGRRVPERCEYRPLGPSAGQRDVESGGRGVGRRGGDEADRLRRRCPVRPPHSARVRELRGGYEESEQLAAALHNQFFLDAAELWLQSEVDHFTDFMWDRGQHILRTLKEKGG